MVTAVPRDNSVQVGVCSSFLRFLKDKLLSFLFKLMPEIVLRSFL